jgi:endogenous inhibitor of DNA gyrase (YacG/DUF329 family)
MFLRVKCPTCHREAEWENNPHRPFCSDRCQLIDLGRWTEERYRIPGNETQSPLDDKDDDDGDEELR